MSSTDRLVVSQLFSVARHAGHFKLGSKPVQLNVRLSILPLIHQETYVNFGNYNVLLAFICLHFTLPDTRVLNLLEELYIFFFTDPEHKIKFFMKWILHC